MRKTTQHRGGPLYASSSLGSGYYPRSRAVLRHDFGPLMAGTPSADAFNIVTGDVNAAASGGGTTNEIAARIAQIGTLQNFMAAYKQRLATDKLSAIN